MSFGSIGSINTILKNNRNLLSKPRRRKFKNRIGAYDKISKTQFDLPRAKEYQLRSIKAKIIAQQKIRERKITIVFSAVFVSLTTLIIYWLL